MTQKKLAIIGAGPIGLEAALYASVLGYEFVVFEKNTVAANIESWGHVSLFSPWKMNHSPLGVQHLRQNDLAWSEPDPDACLSGKEYVQSYLKPLSKLPRLANHIYPGVRVVAIGKEQIFKGELIGNDKRAEFPFRMLTVDSRGTENIYHADVVVDASGVYDNHNWLGEGGIPAVGERACEPYITYHLEDIYGAIRSKFAGKRTLLVGAGYSAATTACDFQNLIREEPSTSLLWVIRENRPLPIPAIQNDPLIGRAQLTETANAIAQSASPRIEFRNNTTVDSIHYLKSDNRFKVGLKSNGLIESVEVDRVIANVGYSPDNSIYRELQVHECFASRGPMKLSAALLGSSTDCLAQTSQGADTLKNPEPNFYIIGNKSYGRNSSFLISIGLSQIQEIFTLITGNKTLNLYERRTETTSN
ncbi:MAG: hypothetical protein ACE5HO_16225 [bacterium]